MKFSIFAVGVAFWAAAMTSPDQFPPVDELPDRHELPDPFLMMDGTKVTTAEQWHEQRRPELKALFQHYMYGWMPEPPGIEATIEKVDDNLFGGKATLKQIAISFKGLPEDAPKQHLALFTPNDAEGPSPVFIGLNKCGNHTIIETDEMLVHEKPWRHDACTTPAEEGRGDKADAWCVEYLIDRGWAFATFHVGDLDPDKHDFTDGIHPYYEDLPGPPESHWGTISSWAWGFHRAMDYLVTDDAIDDDAICLIGHSRRGKTALLAAALDDRAALVVPHQSGTGGCALSRNNDQETVERINRVFPHWFNDMFPKFDDREEKLPFDQHLLMALVAPRPLLDTAGLQDTWANYDSAYRALNAADPVYELLGKEGLKGKGQFHEEEEIASENFGQLMQYRRDTKHVLNQGYWRAILDFADAHLQPDN